MISINIINDIDNKYEINIIINDYHPSRDMFRSSKEGRDMIRPSKDGRDMDSFLFGFFLSTITFTSVILHYYLKKSNKIYSPLLF
jgi:hypothetical protein